MSEISGLSAPSTIPDYGSMASMMDKWTAFSSFCGLKGDKTVSETASKLKDLNGKIEAQGKALSQMRRLKTELGTDNDKDKTSADFLAKNPLFEIDLNLALKNAGWAPFPGVGAIGRPLTEVELNRKATEAVLSDPEMLKVAVTWTRAGTPEAGKEINLNAKEKLELVNRIAGNASLIDRVPSQATRDYAKAHLAPSTTLMYQTGDAIRAKKSEYAAENAKVRPEFYTGGLDGKVTRRQLAEKLEVLENEQKANVQSINEVMTELSQAIQHQGNNWERLADVIKKLGDLIDGILRNTQ